MVCKIWVFVAIWTTIRFTCLFLFLWQLVEFFLISIVMWFYLSTHGNIIHSIWYYANIHFIVVNHFLLDEMQMTCFKFNSLLMQNLTMVLIKSILIQQCHQSIEICLESNQMTLWSIFTFLSFWSLGKWISFNCILMFHVFKF